MRIERALPVSDHAELVGARRLGKVVGQVDATEAGVEFGEEAVLRLGEAFVVGA